MYVVRLSVVDHLGVVLVEGGEGVTEVRVEESTVGIVVVSSDESVDIIFVAVLSELLQNILEVWCCQPPPLLDIKHLESVHQVEVPLQGKSDSRLLHLSLVVDQIFDNCDEFILSVHVQRALLWEMSLDWWHELSHGGIVDGKL